MHEDSSSRCKTDEDVHEGAVPAYLLDRENTFRAKVLSNTIKQKRKEKAGKWEVPLPKRRMPLTNGPRFARINDTIGSKLYTKRRTKMVKIIFH
ncbi:hypothetical protein YC2023_079984 [Brassica napus]